MQVLEEILEEIEEYEKHVCEDYSKSVEFIAASKRVFIGIDYIIRKHMNDGKCGDCSRRKWYQKGYEDGKKNDGWISVSKYGLPKDEGVYDLTIIDGRGVYDSVRWQFLEGTHLSGTQHYVDGVHYWADNYRGDPINEFLSERVIAWKKKPEPYRPERSEGK